MENRDDMEMRLWDLIDGRCDAAEKEQIQKLIDTDEQWRNLYDEINAFNGSIQQNITLEQPSMRFTVNVMEDISKAKIAPAIKGYINMGVVRGILAVFFIAIGYLVAIVLRDGAFSGHVQSLPAMNRVSLDHMSSNLVVYMMISVSILLVLLVADHLLRMKGSAGDHAM